MSIKYEEAVQELQSIVAALQEDRVSVDELSAKVKRAAELIQHCREKLRTAEEDLGGLFEG
jgi:exodeoxyribonuclease VII small subunit